MNKLNKEYDLRYKTSDVLLRAKKEAEDEMRYMGSYLSSNRGVDAFSLRFLDITGLFSELRSLRARHV